MKSKIYFGVTSLVFALIAVMHALRLFNSWHAQIGGTVIPIWVSWVAVLFAGFLAYSGYKLKSGK